MKKSNMNIKNNFINYFNRLNNLTSKKGKSFIHFSAIRYSNSRENSIDLNKLMEENNRMSEENLLQIIKYSDKASKEDLVELGIPSYKESFPWLTDDNGDLIDYSKSINLFDGVKLISNYLSKRYDIDGNTVSDNKLTELLKPFTEGERGKNVTVLELYNHVAECYKKDKDSFTKIVNNLTKDPENFIQENKSIMDNISNAHKPLGVHGDITLNEAILKLKDLNWEFILDKGQLTLNVVPAAIGLVGYGLVLKSYMKYVHNRPYEPSIVNNTVRHMEAIRIRKVQLAIFTLLGAPAVLHILRKTASPNVKDIFTISFFGEKNTNTDINSSNLISNNPFLLLLTNFSKKIPYTVKLGFKLIFIILLVLKLLGVSYLDIFSNGYYFKMYCYTTCSLVIFYEILSLYLLYLFANKKINISDILPDFLINWLKAIRSLSEDKATIKWFKENSYIHILIYLTILCLVIII